MQSQGRAHAQLILATLSLPLAAREPGARIEVPPARCDHEDVHRHTLAQFKTFSHRTAESLPPTGAAVHTRRWHAHQAATARVWRLRLAGVPHRWVTDMLVEYMVRLKYNVLSVTRL
ncbi:hypothetical protein BDW22DRAFT_964739 [Trametopsis cervina]|nr:hypothetical protein BDW22DRAFT_964739 [Trametopsis cervina]